MVSALLSPASQNASFRPVTDINPNWLTESSLGDIVHASGSGILDFLDFSLNHRDFFLQFWHLSRIIGLIASGRQQLLRTLEFVFECIDLFFLLLVQRHSYEIPVLKDKRSSESFRRFRQQLAEHLSSNSDRVPNAKPDRGLANSTSRSQPVRRFPVSEIAEKRSM